MVPRNPLAPVSKVEFEYGFTISFRRMSLHTERASNHSLSEPISIRGQNRNRSRGRFLSYLEFLKEAEKRWDKMHGHRSNKKVRIQTEINRIDEVLRELSD